MRGASRRVAREDCSVKSISLTSWGCFTNLRVEKQSTMDHLVDRTVGSPWRSMPTLNPRLSTDTRNTLPMDDTA